MKKITLFILGSISIILISCHKDHVQPATPLSMLQYKWTVDSVILYSNIDFTGVGQKVDNVSGYADFRLDNKEYDFGSVTLNGVTQTSYDTSVYHLKVDNKTLINNIITDGQVTSSTDSSIINTLNDKNLVISNLNDNGIGYYLRTYLHR